MEFWNFEISVVLHLVVRNVDPHPFIHINFLKTPNKKIYNRAKELYCDATIFLFWFFIVYLSKKTETEKWPKAADSRLLKKFSICMNSNLKFIHSKCCAFTGKVGKNNAINTQSQTFNLNSTKLMKNFKFELMNWYE